jgi:hypothetical protein
MIYDNDYFSSSVFKGTIGRGSNNFKDPRESSNDEIVVKIEFTDSAREKVNPENSKWTRDVVTKVSKFIKIVENNNSQNIILSYRRDKTKLPNLSDADVAMKFKAIILSLTAIFDTTKGNEYYICDYFKKLHAKSDDKYEEYQGKFGEVFTIYKLGPSVVEKVLRSYNVKNQFARLDFCFTSDFDIEVKTTINSTNHFILKNHQLLNRGSNSYIATVSLMKTNQEAGLRCSDLISEILTWRELSNTGIDELKKMFNTALELEDDLEKEKIYFSKEVSKVLFYEINDVPKITNYDEVLIEQITFSAKFDNNKAKDIKEIQNKILDLK